MTKPWHAPLRGLIAPLVALLAVPVGLVFVCSCHAQDGLPLLLWQLATMLGLLLAVRSARLRARPSVPAGLVGVLTWLALGPAFFPAADAAERQGGGGTMATLLGAQLALALAASAVAAAVAERASVMRETSRPGRLVPGATLALALVSLGWLAAVGARGVEPRAITGEVLGWVEIPAAATVVRERFARSSEAGRAGLQVEALVEPVPGGDGAATASLRLSLPALGTSDACSVPVGPSGRLVEVVRQADAFVVHWPESPHGEVFGGCTFDAATLALRTGDEVARHAPPELAHGLGAAGLFGLLVLASGWRVRRRHARLARSPEIEVSAPGLATMPDGSPAVVPESLPVGARLVALRIADVRPADRRAARTSVEELVEGQKAALLCDLSRRVRTLELLALLGTMFLASFAFGAGLAGLVLVV
jgi:hypothetical protein